MRCRGDPRGACPPQQSRESRERNRSDVAYAARRLAGGTIDRRIAVTAPAYLIGGTASYWVSEQVAGFLG